MSCGFTLMYVSQHRSLKRLHTLSLQTMLRIWDCFLLEGPKVLFRFSLAVLKQHEKEIILKKETISVMRHLKACGKVTYDVDGLVKVCCNDSLFPMLW